MFFFNSKKGEKIRDFFSKKFGVEIGLISFGSMPEVPQGTKRVIVFYAFDCQVDKYSHFRDSIYTFKRASKKFGYSVDVVAHGPLDFV